MKRPRKLLCFAAALLLGLTFVATPARADTGDATLQITDQPAKLILQLGPGWAGTRFELRTDAGMYPQPVVVGNDGVLRMDLGGSKTYTLSCLQAATQSSTAATPASNAAAGTTPDHAGTLPGPDTSATTDVDLDAFLAGLTEPGTEAPVEQPPPREEPAQRIVPVKQILIFGGGIVAAVIALVILSRLKKRRLDDDEEEDYED